MTEDDQILVTGAAGLVGSTLVTALRRDGLKVFAATREHCDLMDRGEVRRLFAKLRPSAVFHCAGYVNGIAGNMANQGDGYLKNALINTHVIEACRQLPVAKLVAMGTVAMYPAIGGAHPRREGEIWDGKPHAGERGYAEAKRAMLAQLEVSGLDWACAISTNLYGPGDRFDTVGGHCIPSLIAKFHQAAATGAKVEIWGDGNQCRDFLHVADAAAALILMMDHLRGAVNLASGETHAIREVAEILGAHTGCGVAYDPSKPVGELSRSYDLFRLRYTEEWNGPQIALADGLRATYDWYAENVASARR